MYTLISAKLKERLPTDLVKYIYEFLIVEKRKYHKSKFKDCIHIFKLIGLDRVDYDENSDYSSDDEWSESYDFPHTELYNYDIEAEIEYYKYHVPYRYNEVRDFRQVVAQIDGRHPLNENQYPDKYGMLKSKYPFKMHKRNP